MACCSCRACRVSLIEELTDRLTDVNRLIRQLADTGVEVELGRTLTQTFRGTPCHVASLKTTERR